MLIPDLLPALAAALLAVVVAVPMALALWRSGPRPARAGARLVLGALLAAAPAAGFSLGMLAGDDRVLWPLSQAASGLPVVVMAIMVRLSGIVPDDLRIATVSGLSPLASARFVLWPLILPAILAGGLLVFAAVLAERLPTLGTGLVLPIAAITAGLVAINTVR